jgi:hypothetical protein
MNLPSMFFTTMSWLNGLSPLGVSVHAGVSDARSYSRTGCTERGFVMSKMSTSWNSSLSTITA